MMPGMVLFKRLEMDPKVIAASMVDNVRFSQYIIYILLGIAGAFILYNIILAFIQWTRTLACLNNDNQQYFRTQHPIYAWAQRHILLAPLFSQRHSERIYVGPIIVGLLPTRLQSLLILGIVIMNVILATNGIEWHGSEVTLLWHFRNRLGILALTNMIPLVLIAGRNNPLIFLTRISYSDFNLMHRWFGRLVIALTIAHGSTEFYYMDSLAKKMHKTSLKAFGDFLREEDFLLFGFIAFLSMLCILMTSFPAFRHAFYETFLHLHIALVALILASLWIHLADIPSQNLVKVIIALWAVERLIRLTSLLYRNIGANPTRATIEILPGEVMRVTLRVARPWQVQPGQHIFLTLPTIGLWTSHPFSIAWSDNNNDTTTTATSKNTDCSFLDLSNNDTEKGLPPLPPSSSSIATPQTISLLIRPRTGMTRSLYHRCLKTTSSSLTLPALISGPHTSSSLALRTLSSHGTILLIAGGVGITAFLPLLPHLTAGYTAHTSATRRVTLIWIVRTAEQLDWLRRCGWMTQVLAHPGRREVLRVKQFVTTQTRQQPADRNEGFTDNNKRVEIRRGRPDVRGLVEREAEAQVGAMAVACCGPGGLGDEVRGAVRREVGRGRAVEYLEEGFGW